MKMKINIGERWPIHVMYLVIRSGDPNLPPDSLITPPVGLQERHIELTKVQPTEKFFEMVREEVRSHMVDGKEAPKEIAAAIMNISDDLKSDRDPILRAGDYIALMGYARSKKIV
jgi:hypothetical protein